MDTLTTFDVGDERFNVRTVAVFLRDDRVLLHRDEQWRIWALPGGRLSLGESSETALRREVEEELGTAVAAARLVWICEDFFEHLGKRWHEVGFYYLVEAADPAALPSLVGETVRRDELGFELTFRWFAFDELDAIELNPAFLRTALRNIPTGTEHRVVRSGVLQPSDAAPGQQTGSKS